MYLKKIPKKNPKKPARQSRHARPTSGVCIYGVLFSQGGKNAVAKKNMFQIKTKRKSEPPARKKGKGSLAAPSCAREMARRDLERHADVRSHPCMHVRTDFVAFPSLFLSPSLPRSSIMSMVKSCPSRNLQMQAKFWTCVLFEIGKKKEAKCER